VEKVTFTKRLGQRGISTFCKESDCKCSDLSKRVSVKNKGLPTKGIWLFSFVLVQMYSDKTSFKCDSSCNPFWFGRQLLWGREMGKRFLNNMVLSSSPILQDRSFQ